MSTVTFEIDDQGVGILTLNDPDRLNAMGEEMAKDFRECIHSRLANEERLRLVILTGAGRAFSAGGNLEMLEKKRELSAEENKRRMLDFYDSFLSIRTLGVPLIAAINGHAIGAGLCVACACDIRLASNQAKLGFTFTRLGLHPGMGATWFLPEVIGYAKAAELMLTGKVIGAEDALRIGLVSELVDPANVLEQARRIAAEILACGPAATRQLLETIRADEQLVQKCLEREAACQAVNYASGEFAEGVRAAIEKRKASF